MKDRSSKTKYVIRQDTSPAGESSVSIEMGDGDIELCIVRILLFHEAMSSGNVSDGRHIEREQDRAQDGALWHAHGILDGVGLG